MDGPLHGHGQDLGTRALAPWASSSAISLVLVYIIFILYKIFSRLDMFMYFFGCYCHLCKSYSNPVRWQVGATYFVDEETEVQKGWVTCSGPHSQEIGESLARCLTQVFTEHSSVLGYVPSAAKQPTIQSVVDDKCLWVILS